MIESRAELEERIAEYGFLPMFRNRIKGFSVEEMVNPALWFAPDHDGPWEWKGPIIRSGRVAYGKFFGSGKAGFVTLEWFPHLMNYRRHTMGLQRLTDELCGFSQADVLAAVSELESVRSDELKAALGFGRARSRRRTAFDLVDLSAPPAADVVRKGAARIDKLLGELQMQTRLVISDFEYLQSKSGKAYGWGLARYTTPEALYGTDALTVDCTPEESLAAMRSRLERLAVSV